MGYNIDDVLRAERAKAITDEDVARALGDTAGAKDKIKFKPDFRLYQTTRYDAGSPYGNYIDKKYQKFINQMDKKNLAKPKLIGETTSGKPAGAIGGKFGAFLNDVNKLAEAGNNALDKAKSELQNYIQSSRVTDDPSKRAMLDAMSKTPPPAVAAYDDGSTPQADDESQNTSKDDKKLAEREANTGRQDIGNAVAAVSSDREGRFPDADFRALEYT